MGQAGRLGQAVFGRAGERDFDSILQQALVAHGNEDRLDISAGPEHCTDSFILRILLWGLCVRQKSVGAFLQGRLFELAD